MGRFSDFFSKELGRRQVWLFFLMATFVYILPLVLADFPYLDDNWRLLTNGKATGMEWPEQGRLFAALFYNILTFSNAAPNIFPLPLLVATVVMASALTSLTFHYFRHPNFTSTLVLLPLWYNPFFLQNLSYQYDGPAMALSVAATIYAITFHHPSRTLQWLVPACLVALALGLYQISLNVFLGLCCLELLRCANDNTVWSRWRDLAGSKLAQLVLGCLLYGVSAYPFMDQKRTALLDWSVQSVEQICINLVRVVDNVMLLLHGGFGWVFAGLVLCAIAGSVRLGMTINELKVSGLSKVLIGVVCVLTIPALMILVSGVALIFRDFNVGLRTFMGFAVLLVFLFFLSHLVLVSIHQRLALFLLIPLLAMLSLSFAYGRVLTVQKTFVSSALFSLGYDITSRQQLRDAKLIYMSDTYSDYWLTPAAGAFKQMPVLKTLLSNDFYMLAENLPKVGITHVVMERERRNATRVGYQHFTPLVDSQYYRIYLIGDYGFIVFKEPAPIKSLRW